MIQLILQENIKLVHCCENRGVRARSAKKLVRVDPLRLTQQSNRVAPGFQTVGQNAVIEEAPGTTVQGAIDNEANLHAATGRERR